METPVAAESQRPGRPRTRPEWAEEYVDALESALERKGPEMSPEHDKTRLLFIDDDPAVLDGLRRLLRPMRERWDIQFASGGAAGLEALDSSPPDVLITDIRMAGIDGTVVLRHAADKHPDVVRIVLSGHMEFEEELRRRSMAHKFLTKPCQAEELEQAVEQGLTHLEDLV